MGGLEFANRLRGMAQAPSVIFTTAYPDHAVDAFKVNAVDYLLKPFDIVQLQDSIDRVLSLRHDQGDGGGGPIRPLASTRAAAPAELRPERIPVQRHDRTVFVDADDIFYATAARGYSYLKLEDDQVLVNYTLSELEERLTSRFVRCHRSHLVNLDRIIELRPDFKGGLMLQLGDRQRSTLPVSRRQASGLRERLGL
jgi:DNA-binding LytR/AlgR family response regulator